MQVAALSVKGPPYGAQPLCSPSTGTRGVCGQGDAGEAKHRSVASPHCARVLFVWAATQTPASLAPAFCIPTVLEVILVGAISCSCGLMTSQVWAGPACPACPACPAWAAPPLACQVPLDSDRRTAALDDKTACEQALHHFYYRAFSR